MLICSLSLELKRCISIHFINIEYSDGSLSGLPSYSAIHINVSFLPGEDKGNTNNMTRTQ